ncbi:MAG: hypothetical protein QXR18_10065 [Pyrobaculum sp.]
MYIDEVFLTIAEESKLFVSTTYLMNILDYITICGVYALTTKSCQASEGCTFYNISFFVN